MKLFEYFKVQPMIKNKQLKSIAFILAKLLLGCLLIVAIVIIQHQAVSESNTRAAHHQKVALAVFNKIEARLEQLALQVNAINTKESTSPQIAAINTQLNNLQQYIERINPQSEWQQLQASITQSHNETIKQVVAMQLQLQQLKKKTPTQRYLSAAKLPFKVISIDIWNGEPQATIQLKDEAALMAPHDTRSGWTLVAIRFAPGYAIFKNSQHQFIKVELNQ